MPSFLHELIFYGNADVLLEKNIVAFELLLSFMKGFTVCNQTLPEFCTIFILFPISYIS